LAIVGVVLVTDLKLECAPLLGRDVPALAYSAVVAVAAWRGGVGAGLLATGLALLADLYFFAVPYESFAVARPEVAAQCAVAALEGALIALLTGWLSTARRRLKSRLTEAEGLLETALRIGSREELKQRARVLLARERRARLMLRALPDLLLRIRADGLVLDGQAPCGREEALSEVRGRPIGELFPCAAADIVRSVREATVASRPVTLAFVVGSADEAIHLEAKLTRSGDDEAVAIIRELAAPRGTVVTWPGSSPGCGTPASRPTAPSRS
jgi:hypothetical protein